MTTRDPDLKEIFLEQLRTAAQADAGATAGHNNHGSLIEVPEAGTTVSSAYEQLRNAAEYTEAHLLLQRAIKRFYRRNIFLANHVNDKLAHELIVELVQSGYLRAGRFTTSASDHLQQLIQMHLTLYDALHTKVPREKAVEWTLANLSVASEGFLHPHATNHAFILFTYEYFVRAIDKNQFATWPEYGHYELCLYIAVQQALLKYDIDAVRSEIVSLDTQAGEDPERFREANETAGRLFTAELTAQLRRIVNMNGAALRVLKSMAHNRSDMSQLLGNEWEFMQAYTQQAGQEYAQLQRRLDKGLIKSVVFIFITKVLIGIGIEIPYDLLVYGSIMLLPLVVNMLFPPLYMASLRFGMSMPSAQNKELLGHFVRQLLFRGEPPTVHIPRARHISVARQLAYTFMFAIPVILCIALLYALHFTVLQMLIFFVFFSTASSLGFRLTAMVRELEITRRRTGFLAAILDFFYLPFIVSGQWISRQYGRANLVARFLDVMVELPLKAVLRLVRQWVRFLDERREQLY